jgi:hypothetical protein
MMNSLDNTIKELVPNFADVNMSYDGLTNEVVMLTVTGLWASLGIGDRTNKFTRTPAIGTNVATYGNYPQQIYVTDLQERYKVLNALRYTRQDALVVEQASIVRNGNTWAEIDAIWGTIPWADTIHGQHGLGNGVMAGIDNQGGGPITIVKQRARFGFIFNGTTNVPVTVSLYGHVTAVDLGQIGDYFGTFESPGASNQYVFLKNFYSPFIIGATNSDILRGDSTNIYPNISLPNGYWEGWRMRGKLLFDWHFSYCTNKFW